VSNVTVGKNGRVYRRKFDHAEAQRRVAAGESQSAVARALGVTPVAVARVVNTAVRERMDASRTAWGRKARCPDCGAQTTRTRRTVSHRCTECAARARATSVRGTELRCSVCGEWKPEEEFYLGKGKALIARRGRRHDCRACNNAARREYRNRNRERERAYWREYAARRRGGAEARRGHRSEKASSAMQQ
jgi:hypothetical protein